MHIYRPEETSHLDTDSKDFGYLEIHNTDTFQVLLVLRKSLGEVQEGVVLIALAPGINSVERLKRVMPQAFTGIADFQIVEKNKTASEFAKATPLFEQNSIVIKVSSMLFDTVVERLRLGIGKVS